MSAPKMTEAMSLAADLERCAERREDARARYVIAVHRWGIETVPAMRDHWKRQASDASDDLETERDAYARLMGELTAIVAREGETAA